MSIPAMVVDKSFLSEIKKLTLLMAIIKSYSGVI